MKVLLIYSTDFEEIMRLFISIVIALILASCVPSQQVTKPTKQKERTIEKPKKSLVDLRFIDTTFYPLNSKDDDSKYRVENDVFNGFKFGKMGYRLLLDVVSSGSFELTEEWYRSEERVSFSTKTYDATMGEYAVDGRCKENLRPGSYTLRFVKDGNYLGEKKFNIK